MHLYRFHNHFLPVLMSFISASAFAWGPEGHQTTGYIAQSLLTPKASAHLELIIPNVNLGHEATWMDDHKDELKRSIPGSAQWHFYNLPICDNKSKADLCPKGNCAINRIDEYVQVLSDPNSTKEQKVFAVRVIVHVVGDLHQPLHAGDNNDRGGNKLKVGAHSNLHSEWDHTLVKKLAHGRTPKMLAGDLLSKNQDSLITWGSGRPLDWANESNQYARSTAYGLLPDFSCDVTYLSIDKLPNTYKEKSLGVIERRLAMAGARIASVLNSVLDKPESRPK